MEILSKISGDCFPPAPIDPYVPTPLGEAETEIVEG